MNFRSFTLRRAALVSCALMLGLVLAACSSTTSSQPAASSGGGTGGGTVTVENGAVTITAANLEFDANVIQAAAGEDFTITLMNDDSAPHNLSIYTEEGGDTIVTGTTVEAGQSVTIEVSALEAGTYFFQCDIHPEMNGSVEVSA
jgi:plastocyanin